MPYFALSQGTSGPIIDIAVFVSTLHGKALQAAGSALPVPQNAKSFKFSDLLGKEVEISESSHQGFMKVTWIYWEG